MDLLLIYIVHSTTLCMKNHMEAQKFMTPRTEPCDCGKIKPSLFSILLF